MKETLGEREGKTGNETHSGYEKEGGYRQKDTEGREKEKETEGKTQREKRRQKRKIQGGAETEGERKVKETARRVTKRKTQGYVRQGETGGDTEGETEGRQHETRERQRKRERWRETEEENRVIMDITIIKGLLFTNPFKTFVSATSFCIFTHTTVHYIQYMGNKSKSNQLNLFFDVYMKTAHLI
jgi:hypothetical protein